MSQDLMNYDRMTQLALRGVVRDAIRRVIRENGLPGAHHFYITFLTRFPGVDADENLVKKYPEEVTIVLEHQYWDLKAHDDCFEVTLKFGGVPKYLSVPYTAVTRFHDPSVGFALQFDIPEEMQDQGTGTARAPLTLATLKPEAAPKPKAIPSISSKKAGVNKAENEAPAIAKKVKPSTKKQLKIDPKQATAKKQPAEKDKKAEKNNKERKTKDDVNKVVSLDSFRKK